MRSADPFLSLKEEITMMRAIIAEDELPAREAITAMAAAYGIEVLAACQDGPETVRNLAKYHPDLLFLDVQMPGMDGFEVLRSLSTDTFPAVIFTTAHDNYAVRAFEYRAIDYLLKPFDEERFRKAVDHAQLQRGQVSNKGQWISHLASELCAAQHARAGLQRLVIRSRGEVSFLRVDDIDWIEASHNYLKIHSGPDVHMLRQTIKEIEGRLQPDRFLRIHRCLIVNVDRIRQLEACGYGEYLVVLRDGKKLSLSRGYRDNLDRLIDSQNAPAYRNDGPEPAAVPRRRV
jgi:two-component system, LytTR family, response regulator